LEFEIFSLFEFSLLTFVAYSFFILMMMTEWWQGCKWNFLRWDVVKGESDKKSIPQSNSYFFDIITFYHRHYFVYTNNIQWIRIWGKKYFSSLNFVKSYVKGMKMKYFVRFKEFFLINISFLTGEFSYTWKPSFLTLNSKWQKISLTKISWLRRLWLFQVTTKTNDSRKNWNPKNQSDVAFPENWILWNVKERWCWNVFVNEVNKIKSKMFVYFWWKQE
jgi:hypothetical protein